MNRNNILVLSVLAVSCFVFFGNLTGRQEEKGIKFAAKVLYIHDGDTITVDKDGTKEKIRFLHIDTPESSYNPKAPRDSRRTGVPLAEIYRKGKAATEYLKKFIKVGDLVEIETDKKLRCKYGRILGHVFINGVYVNEEMVRAGYAKLMIYSPNRKYEGRIRKAFREAQENGLKYW